MVNQRGDLKVADFGIARSLSDSVSMLTVEARHERHTGLYESAATQRRPRHASRRRVFVRRYHLRPAYE